MCLNLAMRKYFGGLAGELEQVKTVGLKIKGN